MEFTLEMKTPLWTGGVDGNMDRVHETGLLGSIRWWFEAIVRSLDGTACDPATSDCNKDSHCDACHIFGCTGWSKRFRLEVVDEKQKTEEISIKIKDHPQKNHNGWYVKVGNIGKIKGSIKVLRLDEFSSVEEIENALASTMTIMANWSGFGAKNQIGMGVGELLELKDDYGNSIVPTQQNLITYITKLKNENKSKEGIRKEVKHNQLPHLKDLFFLKVDFNNDYRNEIYSRYKQPPNPDNPNFILSAPYVRYHLRTMLKDKSNDFIKYNLLGVIGSRIHSNPQCLKKLVTYEWKCSSHNAEGVGEKLLKDHKKQHKHNNRVRCNIEEQLQCTACKITLPASQKNSIKEIDKRSSKIKISNSYLLKNNHWQIRVWGWMPDFVISGQKGGDTIKKAQVLNALYMEAGYNIWQELLGPSWGNPGQTLGGDKQPVEDLIAKLLK